MGVVGVVYVVRLRQPYTSRSATVLHIMFLIRNFLKFVRVSGHYIIRQPQKKFGACFRVATLPVKVSAPVF